MGMPTEKEIAAHIETVLPRTCKGMAAKLQAWSEVCCKSHQEAVILGHDGSMNEDLFALIVLAYTYFELAGSSSESWQDLCLLNARAAILKACIIRLGTENNQQAIK